MGISEKRRNHQKTGCGSKIIMRQISSRWIDCETRERQNPDAGFAGIRHNRIKLDLRTSGFADICHNRIKLDRRSSSKPLLHSYRVRGYPNGLCCTCANDWGGWTTAENCCLAVSSLARCRRRRASPRVACRKSWRAHHRFSVVQRQASVVQSQLSAVWSQSSVVRRYASVVQS